VERPTCFGDSSAHYQQTLAPDVHTTGETTPFQQMV
jgi:hypothetical protein